MEASLPTPMTARVYVNLPEGSKWSPQMAQHFSYLTDPGRSPCIISCMAEAPKEMDWNGKIIYDYYGINMDHRKA